MKEPTTIMEPCCEELRAWETSNQAMNNFKNAMEEIRQTEIRRYLKKYKAHTINTDLVEMVTRSLVNRIIRLPAERLNETASRGVSELDHLSRALAGLFDLNNVREAAA